MLPDDLTDSFAALVRARIAADYVLPTHPSGELDDNDIVEWLEGALEFEHATAQALVDGQPVELDRDDINALSQSLKLELRLLNVLLRPTSAELMMHVLQEVLSDGVEDENCNECERLTQEVMDMTADHPMGKLASVAFDMLAHVTGAYADFGPKSDLLYGQMEEVFYRLSPAGQARVLAAALQEQEHELLGRRASPLVALSRLRNDFLSGPARAALDQLVNAEGGAMAVAELAPIIHMRGNRVAKQLMHAFTAAVKAYNEDEPRDVLTAPVEVDRNGRRVVLRVRSEYLIALRSILRAEQSLLAATEDTDGFADFL